VRRRNVVRPSTYNGDVRLETEVVARDARDLGSISTTVAAIW
jgi:hypothetical protein